MKANLNPITARLYRWFYMADEMPSNLCPYFWKCVLMYILIVPYSILSLLFILFPKLETEGNWIEKPHERAFLGFVLYFFLFIIGTMIFSIVTVWGVDNVFYETYQPFYVVGFTAWGIGLIVGICFLISWVRDKIVEKKRQRRYEQYHNPKPEKPESIVKAFIKAKYHKYCPKMEWYK